jgi:membrane protein required for colicin V production
VNWLDVLLGLILAGSIVGGFMQGFARVGVGLAMTVVAVLFSVWTYGVAGGIFGEYLKSRTLANLLGFLLTFILVMAAGSLVGWLLAKIFKWTGLGWLDRTLGALFGVLRGLVIAIALVMAIMAFAPEPPPQAITGSRLAPYVLGAADVIAFISPREVRDGFNKSYETLRKLWNEAVKVTPERVPAKEI